MEKRSFREIEKDLGLVKLAAESATSWKQLSEITGLTVQKIRTTLASHPVVKNRIIKLMGENLKNSKAEDNISHGSDTMKNQEIDTEKPIVITETSALIDGLQSCLATPVIVPMFVLSELEKLSQGNKKAQEALLTINITKDWISVAPNLYKNEILLKEVKFPVKNRSRGIVALACYYKALGYEHISIKTRSSEVSMLARFQKAGFVVDFVPIDEKIIKS